MDFSFQGASWTNRFQESVWHEYSGLARKFNALNLGQGFPNFLPPHFLIDAAKTALDQNLVHAYARPQGALSLVKMLAKIYSPLVGQELNPETQFQITNGASGGIFVTILSIINPGDEVIVLAPWFDLYDGAIAAAGGVTVEVPLRLAENSTSAGDWKLDIQEFKAAITPKTKAVFINTPHNPTGKVFSVEELTEIADVVKQHPHLVVIADEVYEWICYQDFPRMCTIPGMWERTINISSAGKVFATTGWKVGWAYGHPQLINKVAVCHQFAAFSVSSVSQEALALAYETAIKENYFQQLRQDYEKRKQTLFDGLSKAGLKPLQPQGSFFIVCDISKIQMKPEWGTDPSKSITKQNFDKKDWNFCRWLTTDIGVAAIPCSCFFATGSPQNMVRFAFCKSDQDLQAACTLLEKLSSLVQ